MLNTDVQKVQIYSITGQLIKSFNNQLENYEYPISDLEKGIYIIKVLDTENREKSIKLIKQ